jgi:hypothetical protein
MARRSAETTDELQQAVFRVAYHSAQQRRRRALAVSVLALKQGARGLWLLWPLVALGAAAICLPGNAILVPGAMLLVPGLLVWFYIHAAGARADYRRLVRGRLLGKDDWKHLARG